MTETRSTGSAILMLNLGLKQGFTAQQCLDKTGLSLELLSDSNAMIKASQELALIKNLASLDLSHSLALEAGPHYHLTTYGIWGFALATSATLRSAIEVGLNYLALTFAFSNITLQEDDSNAYLQVEAEHLEEASQRFVVERDTSAIVNIHRELFSPIMPITEVQFRWDKALDDRCYQASLGLVPKFNQDMNGVIFKRELLDLPLPGANENSRQILIAQCQDLLQNRLKDDSAALKVRDYIIANLDQNIDMETVAKKMCVSLRTLRRMLSNEGTSFRKLMDEVRETLALELIQGTNLRLEDIAYRLGYSDTANFFHAFKRWKGLTPNHFRKTNS